MATVPIKPMCPQCESADARLLAFNSANAYVDYFRCPQCGHVWNQPKPGETGPIRDVTRATQSDSLRQQRIPRVERRS